MTMQSFFERFDAFFSVYSNIELRVEYEHDFAQTFEIMDEVCNCKYTSAWWKDLEIIYFCFDYENQSKKSNLNYDSYYSF